jgi:hypothetical protein
MTRLRHPGQPENGFPETAIAIPIPVRWIPGRLPGTAALSLGRGDFLSMAVQYHLTSPVFRLEELAGGING